MKALRGHISGLCVPQYMIDLPGGKGKMALLPPDVKSVSDDRLVIENYLGERCEYPF
jgi:lysine 2,3-aminomutase